MADGGGAPRGTGPRRRAECGTKAVASTLRSGRHGARTPRRGRPAAQRAPGARSAGAAIRAAAADVRWRGRPWPRGRRREPFRGGPGAGRPAWASGEWRQPRRQLWRDHRTCPRWPAVGDLPGGCDGDRPARPGRVRRRARSRCPSLFMAGPLRLRDAASPTPRAHDRARAGRSCTPDCRHPSATRPPQGRPRRPGPAARVFRAS